MCWWCHVQVVKKNSKVLLMCAVGGTLDTNVTYRRDKKLFAGENVLQHACFLVSCCFPTSCLNNASGERVMVMCVRARVCEGGADSPAPGGGVTLFCIDLRKGVVKTIRRSGMDNWPGSVLKASRLGWRVGSR